MKTLTAICKFFFSLLLILCFILSAPFAIGRAIEHWNDPEAIHSGAAPDCAPWLNAKK